jgi:hypothetical protein
MVQAPFSWLVVEQIILTNKNGNQSLGILFYYMTYAGLVFEELLFLVKVHEALILRRPSGMNYL